MLAAGHINDKTEEISTEHNRLQMLDNKRKFFQVILSDLYTRDFQWTLNKTIDSPADIMLEIANWDYSKWYIKIEPFVTPTTIYNVYGKIASIELVSDIKVTIAVSTKKEFDLLKINHLSP